MKRPSFQFYPSDWLSDPNVCAMTPEQEGAYIRLLALMWNTEDCELWNNEEYLCKLSRVDRLAIALPLRCFKVSKRNKENITHKRLLEERAKQDEHREKMSKAGKLGNKIRHGNEAEISLSDSQAIARTCLLYTSDAADE